MSTSPLLSVKALNKRFGGLSALSDYSLQIEAGDFVGLIGPNGAGKTTIFNLLSGVIFPSEGSVHFAGQDVSGMRADQRARLGMSRTFQNIRLFQGMTVLDNVRCALDTLHGRGFWATVCGTPAFRQTEKNIYVQAMEELARLDLLPHAGELAGNLPYGLQRRVEIARALAAVPKLLLLDEPAAGLNPIETAELIEVIDTIHRSRRLAILLVEHDMNVVMKLCARIQVINQGRLLMEGEPAQVRSDQRVVDAYLGVSKRRGNA